VPDRFGDNHRAKAYYGAFRLALGDEAFARVDEERYVEEALHVDQVVSDAIALHSINPQNIESEVRKELLKRYYDMFGGLEMAKTVIEQMVEIVRYGAAARAG
jgi:type I restriction enzyme R subunit